MKTPTIHLNGNTAESLLLEASAASGALRKAREALCNMTIHPRNYYPQGPDAYNEAREQYHAMLERFDEVAREVESYGLAIWEIENR